MEKSISATLARAALKDASRYAREKQREADEAMEARNRLIRDARRAGFPYTVLMTDTELSRDRLIKIAQTPDAQEP